MNILFEYCYDHSFTSRMMRARRVHVYIDVSMSQSALSYITQVVDCTCRCRIANTMIRYP
jgi:hypothetical protein